MAWRAPTCTLRPGTGRHAMSSIFLQLPSAFGSLRPTDGTPWAISSIADFAGAVLIVFAASSASQAFSSQYSTLLNRHAHGPIVRDGEMVAQPD